MKAFLGNGEVTANLGSPTQHNREITLSVFVLCAMVIQFRTVFFLTSIIANTTNKLKLSLKDLEY